MAEMRIGNARRHGFTALALVWLWMLTFREYWIACNEAIGRFLYNNLETTVEVIRVGSEPHSWYLAASMGFVPILFLAVSSCTSVSELGSWWLAGVSGASAATTVAARWLGLNDSGIENYDGNFDGILTSNGPSIFGPMDYDRVAGFRAELLEQHGVAWPWLFIPLILTTAFVIVGSRRRALRDATQPAADEAE